MDAIFKALNDPARRLLLDSLRKEDGQTLSDLQTQLDMTRFGVMKHLAILEEAQLITTRKVGRFKHHYLNAAALQEVIDRWIEPFRAKSAARTMLDLKSQLEGTTLMTDKPDFVMQTYIRCTLSALWEALTNPIEMTKYHFMAKEVTQDGDTYTYKTPDGSADMMYARTIEETPKTRIEATFEPRWDGGGDPSRTVFVMREEGEFCSLMLEHYDLTFPAVHGEGVADGWARWSAGLKSYLETGEAIKFMPEQTT